MTELVCPECGRKLESVSYPRCECPFCEADMGEALDAYMKTKESAPCPTCAGSERKLAEVLAAIVSWAESKRWAHDSWKKEPLNAALLNIAEAARKGEG